jgi:psiF repeat
MTFCATILSFIIATAVASAQTPSPSAAAPVASPTDKQATSKACSDQADAKGLHGKARKKFRSECKKRGWHTAVTGAAATVPWALGLYPSISLLADAPAVTE